MDNQLRQRRVHVGAEDNSAEQKSKVVTQGESVDKTCTRCIIVLLLLAATFFTTVYTVHSNNGNLVSQILPKAVHKTVDKKLSELGLYGFGGRQYAVVIDAGSTGTRVLGFSFHRSILDGSLKLDDELWQQVKPGLSWYHEQPENCSQGLLELLASAKKRVPKEYWPSTPITLKATAGLRLLPDEQADAILSVVRKVLVNSGFKPEDNLIEIMNPMEEGLYGWFTVNFLLDQFDNADKLDHSFVSLDLGGGSTQITFAPSRYPVKGLEGRKHFMHDVNILKKLIQVYSHSYLGLGLMAAREGIIKASSSSSSNNVETIDGDVNHVTTACMAAKTIPKEWSFHGKNYQISHLPTAGGSIADDNAFGPCSALVKDVIRAEKVHRPSELLKRNVAAFSYFFDLAVEHGLVNDGGTEALVKVGDYETIARGACAPGGGEHRFACMDLSFISVLLTDGYGLPPEKELHLYKKISGHEASWALGLAYNILETT